MAYASGMKYDEFWNATLPEALASVDGYLKRQEDYLRGIRRLCWFVVMPWIDKNERGSEYEIFPINGDPTEDEIKEMREKANDALIKKLKQDRDRIMEEERRAAEYMDEKL
jgi:hypothetical protein